MQKMQTTKRYKTQTQEECSKERQLSGLFSIISSNILLATQVISPEYKIKTVGELESLSRKARILAKELMYNTHNLTKEDLTEKISQLKQRMIDLVSDLSNELCNYDSNNAEKNAEDIILAKRLLRDSQRGLATIQD